MLSPVAIKLIRMMPEGIIIKIAKKIVDNYIRKYANITVNGADNIDKVKKTKNICM